MRGNNIRPDQHIITRQHSERPAHKVLMAVLDWGLGHATRSIPIIRELQRQGCGVSLAGSGDSLLLLKSEFPSLSSYDLPAYAPKYPSSGSMVAAMARQLPRLFAVISAEQEALKRILAATHFDLIVSDNRYGCHAADTHSVFITHQSNILMPQRFGWLQGLVRRMSGRMIRRFDTCWIPDVPGHLSLAGDLTSQGGRGVDVYTQHIGWLSRFQRQPQTAARKYDVVAIFSGPEPQRTIFEGIVTRQLNTSGLSFRIVRGLPGRPETGDPRVVNFMASSELQECIASADVIIARSGYSTIMDLYALGKKAILVPTPGQTEQEYLAGKLMEKRIAFSMRQDRFDLDMALKEVEHYSGFDQLPENTLLARAVASALGRISDQ